jgi:excinuclease UvrABC nuclease subunit
VLCDLEVARVPTHIPGIYLIHSFDRTWGYYPALYVGKTRDLRARMVQHMETASTSPDFRAVREEMATYFSAAPVLESALRDGVEAGLIRLLRPPFNRQVPQPDPTYVNLPPMSLEVPKRGSTR